MQMKNTGEKISSMRNQQQIQTTVCENRLQQYRGIDNIALVIIT